MQVGEYIIPVVHPQFRRFDPPMLGVMPAERASSSGVGATSVQQPLFLPEGLLIPSTVHIQHLQTPGNQLDVGDHIMVLFDINGRVMGLHRYD